MKIFKRRIIKTKNGSVAHMYSKNKKIFKKISEIYFSNILPNKINAWKMTDSEQFLTVPRGQVLFVVKSKKGYKKIKLGYPNNYKAIYIKPKTWYGFKCISNQQALICNVTSLTNSDAKKEKRERNFFKFKWN